MRLKKIKGAKERILNSNYLIKDNNMFNNSNPIHIEIGTGKGQFIYEMARNNPNTNFIGLEKYESVLIKAIEKQELNPLPNLKYMLLDANDLPNYFSKKFAKIYLNFSDPWPKLRHEKRRLTHKNFLDIYKSILIDSGSVVFKTDNTKLFEYSIVSLNNYGTIFTKFYIDLHNSDVAVSNIMTEYEVKFSSMGELIKLVEFKFVV